jgi:hypothetical protein
VIAISSLDRETGCWSFWDDCFDVWDILNWWRSDWGLDHLPLYGVGVSSGGSFVMKLPRYIKVRCRSSFRPVPVHEGQQAPA